MQQIEAIKQEADDGDVIVLLQDSFGEPHERVRAVFDNTDELELYIHHCMDSSEVANSRVETHTLREGMSNDDSTQRVTVE